MFSIFPYSGQPYSSIPDAAPNVITGNLAASEANDTLAASGKVLIKGSLARTEANDTLAASGKVLVKGSLAAIESNDIFAAAGVIGDVYQWDTSQGKAPSNLFTPLRQTVSQAKKAGLKLATAKVKVTTVFTPPAVHSFTKVKTTAKRTLKASAPAKAKVFSSSIVRPKEQKVYSATRKVSVFKPNTVCINSLPRGELSYSIPNVITSGHTIVRINARKLSEFGSYKTKVTTVQNPTDDELRAIILIMKQQKAARFRKML